MPHNLSELTQLGRYKLIRELGRGGMSVVYLANDTELGREVAIKCVDKQHQAKTKLAERLRAEAQLLAQLNHPNIVQLYDVVEEDNILGLVIEYIGGDTLTQRLRHAPTKEIKLKWLAEIADGLANAHTKGIAHCDLKADNVLITNDNIAKIADFGIAKVKLDDYLEDDGLTRVDSVSGSYFSLSPEQATGRPVDTRTDLFSFAILCFQSLIGEHPFGDTSNKVALLQRTINDPLELSAKTTAELGSRLVDLLSNLLSKQPTERIYNASEAAALIRGASQNSNFEEHLDHTMMIETLPAASTTKIITQDNSSKWRGISIKALLITAGFLVGIALIKLLPSEATRNNEIKYIALDEIELKATEGFSKTLLPLIKTTVQQSAEKTILSFRKTGLVDSKELNSTEGNFSQKAGVAGVDNVLIASVSCSPRKCDIKLQRRSGERMAVTSQTIFPVSPESLVDMHISVSDQLSRLFNENAFLTTRYNKSIDEKTYRDYLQIYNSTNGGASGNETQYKSVKRLVSTRPDFIPGYTLAYRIANYIDENFSHRDHVNEVKDIFKNSPPSVQKDLNFRSSMIQVEVSLGKLDRAKVLFSELKNTVNDELFLNEVESVIAYAENDYERLLVLDRKNAAWRPSIENLYNLAASEFLFGNYENARAGVDKVLGIRKNDSYALELKATIELNSGDVVKAIETYETLLGITPKSLAYSNLGVALSLNREMDRALSSHKKALENQPNNASFHLNLADSYNLLGDKTLANKSYFKVIELLKSPKTPQDFGILAQSHAHLEQHQKAVKTLKVAKSKFQTSAELDYAASIVNTLAGNNISALIDIRDALDRGTAPIWFSFVWFKPLCSYDDFKKMTLKATRELCN